MLIWRFFRENPPTLGKKLHKYFTKNSAKSVQNLLYFANIEIPGSDSESVVN